MKKYLIIEADTNDGDYITSRIIINDEQLEQIKPVIDAIKNFEPYETNVNGLNIKHSSNYPRGDGQFIPRKDLGEKSAQQIYGHLDGFKLFDTFTPHNIYGIHSIVSVDLLIVQDEIKLL